MKITIITVVYNDKANIEKTISSVISQNYHNLEYIIIDGGSDDGTIDVIKNYCDRVDVLISEKDKGIYDALNKGVAIAKGDVIAFLHSDDVFNDNNTLNDIANFFKNNKCDGLYGNLEYIRMNKIFRKWVSGEFRDHSISMGWMPPHPTLYLKSHLYKEIGKFSLEYKISSDYDFICRLFHSKKYTIKYFDKFLVKMQVGGASNASIRNIFLKMREDYKVLSQYARIPLLILTIKNLRKIPQLFHK